VARSLSWAPQSLWRPLFGALLREPSNRNTQFAAGTASFRFAFTSAADRLFNLILKLAVVCWYGLSSIAAVRAPATATTITHKYATALSAVSVSLIVLSFARPGSCGW